MLAGGTSQERDAWQQNVNKIALLRQPFKECSIINLQGVSRC
jgi:hypothetical protein